MTGRIFSEMPASSMLSMGFQADANTRRKQTRSLRVCERIQIRVRITESGQQQGVAATEFKSIRSLEFVLRNQFSHRLSDYARGPRHASRSAPGRHRDPWPRSATPTPAPQDLALRFLAGSQPIAQLARQHQVSRQFLYGERAMKKNNLSRSISTTTVALILLAGAAVHAAAQQPTRRYPTLAGVGCSLSTEDGPGLENRCSKSTRRAAVRAPRKSTRRSPGRSIHRDDARRRGYPGRRSRAPEGGDRT